MVIYEGSDNAVQCQRWVPADSVVVLSWCSHFATQKSRAAILFILSVPNRPEEVRIYESRSYRPAAIRIYKLFVKFGEFALYTSSMFAPHNFKVRVP